MTRNGQQVAGLDKLEAALDTYGADRTRWPAPLRHALSSIIAGSAEAQKLMADAEAFDRLLDQAPQYEAANLGKLKDRIALAAERQPRLMVSKSAARSRPPMGRFNGLAASALAASLVLGIFAGQSKTINSTAEMLLGEASGSMSSSRQMAQTDEADSLLDEDLL